MKEIILLTILSFGCFLIPGSTNFPEGSKSEKVCLRIGVALIAVTIGIYLMRIVNMLEIISQAS